MFCTTCGKELPEGSRVCTGCGTPIQAPVGSEELAQAQIANASVEQPEPVYAPAAQVERAHGVPQAQLGSAYALAMQAGQAHGVPQAQSAQAGSAYGVPQAQPTQVYADPQAQPSSPYGAPQAQSAQAYGDPQAQPGFPYAGAPQATPFVQAQSAGPLFPNASRGLKNLFTAEVIMAASLGGTLFLALATSLVGGSRTAMATAATFVGLVAVLAGILLVIAYVMRVVALYQASKDELFFQRAFVVTIVALVLAVVSVFFRSGTWGTVLNSASSILSLVVFIAIWRGIISLAKKVGRNDIASSGNTMFIVAIVCYALAFLLPFVLLGVSGSPTPSNLGLVGMLGIVILVAAFVPEILLLVILSKAKNMFKQTAAR